MTTKKKDEAPAVTPDPDEPLKDVDGDPIDPEKGGITPPDLDAPTTPPPAEPAPEFHDSHAVTMADVAALSGIGLAPDESPRTVVAAGDVPFISAGMASDLEQQGWALDPVTGRRVEREPKE